LFPYGPPGKTKAPKGRSPSVSGNGRPTRQQLTIDIQHFPEVRDVIREEAKARQYAASEPFLRRILVVLFLKGELKKLSI